MSLEAVKEIEPSYSAWEADVLPLNYTAIIQRLPVSIDWVEASFRFEWPFLVPLIGSTETTYLRLVMGSSVMSLLKMAIS